MIAFKGVVSRETCLAFWKYDFSEGMRKELCRAVQTAFLDVLFIPEYLGKLGIREYIF